MNASRNNSPRYRGTFPFPVEALGLGLSAQAFRLLAHLIWQCRRDVNGECWDTTRELIDATGLSAGAISKAKRQLVQKTFANGEPVISIETVPNDSGGRHRHVITAGYPGAR